MSAEMTLIPRLKRSGEYLKATWYWKEESSDISVVEVHECILEGAKISFDFKYNGIHAKKLDPYQLIFNLAERINKIDCRTDTDLTRRILINGGLTSYISKLEKGEKLNLISRS